MVSEFDFSTRRFKGWFLFSVAMLGLLHELVRELNPLTGFWVVEKAYFNEIEEPDAGFRIFLEIDNGRASMASYWTCGQPAHTFMEGVMVFDRDKIVLVEENPITKERSSVPSGELKRLANGRLETTILEDNGRSRLIFAREENAKSFFDLFCWN